MAGIYLHIPFCKQACHYCNFHFSTLLRHKEKVVSAIAKELFLRADALKGEPVTTVYFGGGTPSLLNEKELDLLWEVLLKFPGVSTASEVTLEANPDDLTPAFFERIKRYPVNRLSIGIQSFEEADLRLMNRAHTAAEALVAVERSRDAGFEKLSLDLIYGIPGKDEGRWQRNLEKTLELKVPHISAYCLTVEPATVFGHQQRKGAFREVSDEIALFEFEQMSKQLAAAGYEHYEISNLALPNHYSIHNRNYWEGVHYLGVGPGAHSFDGLSRSWNPDNNQRYVQALEAGKLPLEKEELTLSNRINEMIMTGLRTQWGINLKRFESQFGTVERAQFLERISASVHADSVCISGDQVTLIPDYRFLADGIAASLFVED